MQSARTLSPIMTALSYPPSPRTIITDPSGMSISIDIPATPTPTSTTRDHPSPTLETPLSTMPSDVNMTADGELQSPTNITGYPQPTFSIPTESPGLYHSSSSAMKMPQPVQNRRRFSRFDPMGRGEDDFEEEGYGELSGKYPLRRVAEEDGKEGDDLNLPGIKALFGTTGQDRASTPSISRHSSGSLFQSPSLPSLNSPTGSPSTSRTSRYSSLASNSTPSTSASDSFSPNYQGWWNPEPSSGPSRHTPPITYRTYSQPTTHLSHDEHYDKRRRSDGPPALRDAEESARLRWQAQSRNASFPSTIGSISGPSTGYQGGFRTLHPPSVMSGFARGSVSGQGYSPGHSPVSEMGRPVVMRNPSIVGGQLSQSFADLTAGERTRQRYREDLSDMPPPIASRLPDRRGSHFPILHTPPTHDVSRDPSPRPVLPPLHRRQSNHIGIPDLRPGPIRRQSLTRPPTPEEPLTSRPMMRRSSQTDTIAHKPHVGESRESTPKSEFRPTFDVTPGSGWSRRRGSVEDGTEGMRSRKRMGGMEMLVNAVQDERALLPDDAAGKGITGSQGPKYICEYCAKTFTRPSSLRIHVYSHTGERPFVCQEPTCRRSFSVQSNLKRHAKVHQLGGSATYHHHLHHQQGLDPGVQVQGYGRGQAGMVGVKSWEAGDDGEEEDEEMDELDEDDD